MADLSFKTLSKRKSLLAFVALERQLTTALGRKVDLLTEAAISPYLRPRILNEVQVIKESAQVSMTAVIERAAEKTREAMFLHTL